jgi:serine/threonine protein kinase
MPAALVEHAELSQVFQEYMAGDFSIAIIDFDQAFKLSGVGKVGTPDAYCSPEVLFDQRASAASDVWALACCSYGIRGSLQLFESAEEDSESIIRQMVQMLGELPEPWWSKWDVERQKYFDEDGQPRKDWEDGIPLAVKFPVEQAINEIGGGLTYDIEPDNEGSCG